MDEAALSAALADLFALAGQTLPVLPAVGMVPVGDLGTALPLYSLGQSPSHIVAIQDDGDGEGQAAVASEGAGVSPALAGTDVPKRAHPRGSLMATAFLVCWSLLLLGRRLTPPEAFGELWREARSRGARSGSDGLVWVGPGAAAPGLCGVGPVAAAPGLCQSNPRPVSLPLSQGKGKGSCQL